MMNRWESLALAGLVALVACGNESAKKQPEPKAKEPKVEPKKSPVATARKNAKGFEQLPESYAKQGQTKEQEDLGRQLYYDTRLSKNHDISCNSCHLLDKFGVDGKPTSPGHKQQLGVRNSPTVYNAAGNFVQFWDGREPDVEAQAKGPVLNPVEMAMASEEAAVAILKSIPGYVETFKAAFPEDKDPVTYDNMAKAIGAFERKLVTPSRWDKFLAGDDKALTELEAEGFNAFLASGCVSCHAGPLLGANTYQKLGVVAPWPNQKDQGRFDVTKNDADKMMFKVPSLRNISETAPYYHDGSEADLVKVVQTMGKLQLGADITEKDAKAIVAWFGALTGEIPTEYIAQPELPESGKKTPKPDPS